jgi:6,7-dimethyl-8-ribityllumazine synthase
MAIPRKAENKGKTAPSGGRMLVVEARFYNDIADMLLAGASRVLDDAKVPWDLVSVPGALEIPIAAAIALDAAMVRQQPYDGLVALGCVIRGETSHYDIVAGESARALMDLAVARLLPVGNGILTVDTDAQAQARAQPGKYDKGAAAAEAALALAGLTGRLSPARRLSPPRHFSPPRRRR